MSGDAIAAIVIFALTFIGILSGKVHRTISGAVRAVVMVVVGLAMGFYSEEEALAAVDFNTLGLLPRWPRSHGWRHSARCESFFETISSSAPPTLTRCCN